MKDHRASAIIWYGVLKTALPLGFAFIMLYSLSSFLQPYQYGGFQPLPLIYAYFLSYTGFTLILEALFVAPHSKIALGALAFGILLGLAGSCFVFAGLLFTGIYDGIGDNTLNGWLTGTLVVAFFMYMLQGREEFFHKRRFSEGIKAGLFH